ncbi:MAG: glycoside hydrolase family 5 protein [Bacteroidales bacterium]|nr:glycoside hydrolase family 5 protein [Bacteroidales bacterium]
MKKLLFFSILSIALMCCCKPGSASNNGPDVPPPPATDPNGNNGNNNQNNNNQNQNTEPLDNDATRRTMQMGLGWNLGNQLDAYEESPTSSHYLMPDENVWGNPTVTQEAINKVREAGFTTIRIPVTWLGMIGPAPDYKINAKWMARVTEVVGYARNAGFDNIIVDTHHDEDHDDGHWQDLKNASKDKTLNEQIKNEITAVWTQIANNFKDACDWLMFEGFNELNDGGWGHSKEFKANPRLQCDVLNEWLQVFVDAVRATGGNNATRWLGVSTYCANPTFAKYLVLPEDPAGKLMVSVHYYDPSDYTLGTEGPDGKDYLPYSDWGHTGAPGNKHAKYDEDYVQEIFGMLYNTYIANNIPVYIGEIGCSRRDKKDSRSWAFSLYYLEYIAKAARTYCLPAVLWDCGGKGVPGPEHHYYFRHDTGEYYPDAKEAIDVLLKGWFNEDPGYTLQTVYDSAPKF